MRMKKLFAGVLAGAMVVGCMVMPTGASVSYTSEITSVTGTITYDVSNAWFDPADEWGQVVLQAWGGTLTVDNAYATLTDGTTVDVAYDASNTIAIIGDGAVVDDYTTVASITYEVTYDATEMLDSETWIGGGIGVNSDTSTGGWRTIEWGKASGSKPIAIEDTAVMSVTLATEISASDLSADSYDVTLSNAAGETAEVSNNTYFVEGGNYYIGIDVSDVPVDETLSITDVQFN